MSKTNHIEIYARVRPTKRPSGLLQIDYADHAIAVRQPRDAKDGLINNQREHYNFAFSRVLDASTTQETIFETIAQPVVDSTLEGFNGTIFAYGQTGSGKTFTITGGAERYADRGIIPRTLSYIFGKIGGDSNAEVRAAAAAADGAAPGCARPPPRAMRACARARGRARGRACGRVRASRRRCASRTSRSTTRAATTCSTHRTRPRGWRICPR